MKECWIKEGKEWRKQCITTVSLFVSHSSNPPSPHMLTIIPLSFLSPFSPPPPSPLAPQISFTHGNAQSLPSHIQSSSIDIYTIAFGIRNCTDLSAVLNEAYRVLKPGGKLGVLEFGKVGNPVFRELVWLLNRCGLRAIHHHTIPMLTIYLLLLSFLFSPVPSFPHFHRVYKRYSFSVIPMMGQLLAGDRDSYQYLVESIEKFPSQIEFAKL